MFNPIAEIFNIIKIFFSIESRNIELDLFQYFKMEYLVFAWILLILNIIIYLIHYKWLAFNMIFKNYKGLFLTALLIFFLNSIITYFWFDIIIEPKWEASYSQLPRTFTGLYLSLCIPFAIVMFIINLLIVPFVQFFLRKTMMGHIPFNFISKIK
jgi:hypothetical protein